MKRAVREEKTSGELLPILGILAVAAWCIAVAVVLAMSGAARAHTGHHPSATPATLARSVERYVVPDEKLVDASGHAVRARAVLEGDAPTVVNFIFTSCSAICPAMSGTFAQLQRKLGREPVRLVSISIDPEQDTPQRLADYARRFDAGPNWDFYTGSAEASLALQQAFQVYRGDKMGHDPVTFMRAGPRDAWVRLDGFASADALANEYHRLRAH